MDTEQFRAVIESAKAGEVSGFERLQELYSKRLYGYFFRATASHHDAEDLLSELMLRLVRTICNYEHRGRFEPWLFRIAANMVRDRIRRRKARPTPISLSAQSDSGQTLGEQMPGRPVGIDADMLAGELSDSLQASLEGLDVTTREMILLRYFGEMSFKELADIFECPIGTVLARVHRGLKALRKIMKRK